MLGEFLEWWGGQLLAMAPERFRRSSTGSDALIADAGEPGALTLFRRRRGVEQRLVHLRLDEPGTPALRAALNGRPRGEPVLLRPARSAVLERAVSLPLAAERELERVLGYEMERLTPFAADEVFWGYSVIERDRARARLQLRLTMVPRAAVATLVALLTAEGARPTQLESAAPDGLRMMKLAHEGPAQRARNLSARSLKLLAAALAVFVVATPFLRQAMELTDLQDGLDVLAPRVAQAEQLRQRILGNGAGGDAVAAETRRLGDMLMALSAITEILPDDSYLTEFTMRERKMTLSGLGAHAAKLINALSADPRIRAPSFSAPVTTSETNHMDVFSIRAELAR